MIRESLIKIVSKFKKEKSAVSFNYSSASDNFPNLNSTKRWGSVGETKIKMVVWIVVAGLIIVSFLAGRLTSSQSNVSASSSDSQTSVNQPTASQNINKNFNFALKDNQGNPAGNFKYTIVSAETNNEIILKGQKNYSIKGREFLIINLKLTNPNKQSLQVNTRDYIRLSLNGDDSDLLAPDIHNDPVEVQAISTEDTRVGFVISTTDKKLKLIVGEINGPKTDINLNLQ